MMGSNTMLAQKLLSNIKVLTVAKVIKLCFVIIEPPYVDMQAMKKNLVACAKREDSDQPVHLQSDPFWVYTRKESLDF